MGAEELPTCARGFSSLQLLLKTLEKLPGKFLGSLMEKACSDAGNRPAHRHLGSPIHARVLSINGREIHPAGKVSCAPRRFSASLHDHEVGLMFLRSRDIEGEFRFHRSNANGNDRFP